LRYTVYDIWLIDSKHRICNIRCYITTIYYCTITYGSKYCIIYFCTIYGTIYGILVYGIDVKRLYHINIRLRPYIQGPFGRPSTRVFSTTRTICSAPLNGGFGRGDGFGRRTKISVYIALQSHYGTRQWGGGLGMFVVPAVRT